MTIECAVFSVGVIIQVAAFNTWEQVMIGRLVSGLGVGGPYSNVLSVQRADRCVHQLYRLLCPFSTVKLLRRRFVAL